MVHAFFQLSSDVAAAKCWHFQALLRSFLLLGARSIFFLRLNLQKGMLLHLLFVYQGRDMQISIFDHLLCKWGLITAQQFILCPLHLRPLTVVPQDFKDGNGISNDEMPSKSEPHGKTFSQVLQKPSRFIRRPTSSLMAPLGRLKAARIPPANFGAPRSGTPFVWLDGCRQLFIRNGEQGVRSEKTRSPNRQEYEATGVLLASDGQT